MEIMIRIVVTGHDGTGKLQGAGELLVGEPLGWAELVDLGLDGVVEVHDRWNPE